MALRQLEYLIHGDLLPTKIGKHKFSERLVLERVSGEGYQDSTWGKHVGHVKAYVGVARALASVVLNFPPSFS